MNLNNKKQLLWQFLFFVLLSCNNLDTNSEMLGKTIQGIRKAPNIFRNNSLTNFLQKRFKTTQFQTVTLTSFTEPDTTGTTRSYGNCDFQVNVLDAAVVLQGWSCSFKDSQSKSVQTLGSELSNIQILGNQVTFDATLTLNSSKDANGKIGYPVLTALVIANCQ